MKSQKLVLILWGICLVFCLVVMIPGVRYLLIDIGENLILGRQSERVDYWAGILFKLSVGGMVCSTLLFGGIYMVITFPFAKKLKNNIKEDFDIWRSGAVLLTRRTGVVFAVVFAVLLMGFSALLRANFNYIDDVGRNLWGGSEWGQNFFRWVIYIENVLAQMNRILADASPLIQIIAIAIMAFSVTMLACIFSEIGGGGQKRLQIRHAIASLLIAFNPYFLECMSYKYESVGMASSVLFSLVPFLFVSRERLFYLSSFASVFLMCLSYQASSGIYIMMVIITGLFWFLDNEGKTVKDILKFFVCSAVSYLLASGFFYVLSSILTTGTYRSTQLSLSPAVTFYNLGSYLGIILEDFNRLWLVLVVIVMILAVSAMVMHSRRGKVLSLCLSLFACASALVFSYGAYLFLESFAGAPRMMYGIGVFIALMANCAVTVADSRPIRILFMVPVALLAWCFFSYAFIYGNSLGYQSEYERHYEDMILSDLNALFPNQPEKYELLISGTVGYSPLVAHVNELYPINSRLVPVMLTASTWWWGGLRMAYYYSEAFEKPGESYVYDVEDYGLIKSTMSYDILQNGNGILVKLK